MAFSLFSQRNLGGEGLLTPNNVALWFVAIILISLAAFKVITQNKIAVSIFGLSLALGLTLILSFSLIESAPSDFGVGIFVLAFLGIFLFWIALEQWKISHQQFLMILLALTVLGGVHSAVSIVQIHDPHHVAFTLTGYLPLNLAGNQPIGIVQQVNMTATLMATFGLIGLYLTSYGLFNRISVLWRFWVFLSVVMALYVLILSGSRAGLLAFSLGLILLFFSRHKWLRKKILRPFIWLSLIGAAYLLALWLPGLTVSNELLQNKFDKLLLGTDIRWFLYLTSWDMFLQSPWLGYGLGGYNTALVNYVATVGVDPRFEYLDLQNILHPHNELLYWVLQAGLVALLVFVGLAIFYLKLLFKRRLGFALGILALSVPILSQTQLSYPFSLSALHLFLLLFLLQYGVQPYVSIIRFSLSGAIQKISYVGLLLLFSGCTYFSWFTLKSVEDLYAFKYRLFLTAGQTTQEISEMRYFEYASNHPVFKTGVEDVMNRTLIRSLDTNNRYDMQRFIWWAEEYEFDDLSLRTLVNLTKAHLSLEQIEQAELVYIQAIKMYPNAVDLKILKAQIY